MAGIQGSEIELLEQIDSGGMAEVFRARLSSTGGFERIVAVKRILPHVARDPRFRQVFEREISLLSRIQHPSIVQVLHSGEDRGYLYLAMEFVNGETLNSFLLRCQQHQLSIPVPVSCSIASEIAKGLHEAFHARDPRTGKQLCIIHRDLNPRNLMVTHQGQVKIIDFGVAKALSMTQTGQSAGFRGTYGYCAPEQIRGLTVDHRTDIFALGVILWELLAQRPLYTGEQHEIVEKIVHGTPLPPDRFCRGIPHDLSDLVMRMLQKSPDERPESALELSEELERIVTRSYPDFRSPHIANFMDKVLRGTETTLASQEQQQASRTPSHQESKETVRSPKLRTNATRQSRSKLPLVLCALLVAGAGWFAISRYEPAPPPVPPAPPKLSSPDSISGLLGWFSGSDLTAETGTPIESWTNRGYGGIPAEQSSLVSRPIVIRAALGKHHIARFDGVNDFLVLDRLTGTLDTAAAISILVVLNTFDTHRDQVIWSASPSQSNDSGGSALLELALGPAGAIQLRGTAVSLEATSSPAELIRVGRYALLAVVLNGESVAVRFNGQQILLTELNENFSLKSIRHLLFGHAPQGRSVTDPLHGSLAELALYSRNLEQEELEALERYLGRKYDLSIEHPAPTQDGSES